MAESPDTPNAYAPRCGHHGNPLVWLDPALRWRCPHCFPELFPAARPAAGSSPPDYTVLAEQLRAVKHYESEDCWYSCPESEEGCCDDRRTGCDCHAPTMWAAADALEAQASRITELEQFLIRLGHNPDRLDLPLPSCAAAAATGATNATSSTLTDTTDDDERAAIRGELLATLRVTAPKMAARLDDHWREEGTTVQMPVDPVPRTCSVCGEKIKARAETSGRFRTVNWVDSGGSIAGPDPITGPDPYGRLAELADTDPAAYMYLLTRVEQGFTLHVHRPAPTERTYPSDRS